MSNLALNVRGRSIDQYHHEGKTYVEGRKGTPYEIEFFNSHSERVLAVISVDGLNICTGDKTWELGYIVEPYSTLRVPGWRRNSDKVAQFEFSSLKGSYNQHNASGEASSVGVIGCKVFKEKYKYKPLPQPQVVHHHHTYYPWLSYSPTVHWGGPGSMGLNNASWNMTGGMGSAQASYTSSTMRGENISSRTRSAPKARGIAPDFFEAQSFKKLADDGPMGTAWGKDHEFKTTKVSFDREAHPVETLLIYYDSRDRLERRGINIWTPVKAFHTPDAFPGDGCPPPVSR